MKHLILILTATIILAGHCNVAEAQRGHISVFVHAPQEFVKKSALLKLGEEQNVLLSEGDDSVLIAGHRIQAVYYFETQGAGTSLSSKICGGENGDDCDKINLNEATTAPRIKSELQTIATEAEHNYATFVHDSIVAFDSLNAIAKANAVSRWAIADSMKAALIGKTGWCTDRDFEVDSCSKGGVSTMLPTMRHYKISSISFNEVSSITATLSFTDDLGVCFVRAGLPLTGFDFNSSFSSISPRKLHPKWSERIWKAIEKGSAIIGMTSEQAKMSWGEPDNINRTTNRSGTSEQWVYGSGSYLYFTNGILDSIQN